MKVYVTLKKSEYNAEFESIVINHPTLYGNGKAMQIMRNGEQWKLIDCRYIKGFIEEKTLSDVIKDYFGENLVSITPIDYNTEQRPSGR